MQTAISDGVSGEADGDGLQGGKMRWLRIKWCKPEDETCNALLGEQRETDLRSKIEARADPSQAHQHPCGRSACNACAMIYEVIIML